jgi:hypothetical protein
MFKAGLPHAHGGRQLQPSACNQLKNFCGKKQGNYFRFAP